MSDSVKIESSILVDEDPIIKQLLHPSPPIVTSWPDNAVFPTIIIAHLDGHIDVRHSGDTSHKLDKHTVAVKEMLVLGDQDCYLAAYDTHNLLTLWNLHTGQLLGSHQTPDELACMTATRDFSEWILFAGTQGGNVLAHIMAPATPPLFPLGQPHHTGKITHIMTHRLSRNMYDVLVITNGADGNIVIAHMGKVMTQASQAVSIHKTGRLTSMCVWHPRGDLLDWRLIMMTWDNKVHIAALRDKQLKVKLTMLGAWSSNVTTVSLPHPDWKLVGSNEHATCIWNPRRGKRLAIFKASLVPRIQREGAPGGSDPFIVLRYDKTVAIYDLTNESFMPIARYDLDHTAEHVCWTVTDIEAGKDASFKFMFKLVYHMEGKCIVQVYPL